MHLCDNEALGRSANRERLLFFFIRLSVPRSGLDGAYYFSNYLGNTAQDIQIFRRLNETFYGGSRGFRSVSLI